MRTLRVTMHFLIDVEDDIETVAVLDAIRDEQRPEYRLLAVNTQQEDGVYVYAQRRRP